MSSVIEVGDSEIAVGDWVVAGAGRDADYGRITALAGDASDGESLLATVAWIGGAASTTCEIFADDVSVYVTEAEAEAEAERRRDMVTLETMPTCWRGSHRAAGNWGQYPQNGSERRTVTREEAEAIVAEDEDGYDHIVE